MKRQVYIDYARRLVADRLQSVGAQTPYRVEERLVRDDDRNVQYSLAEICHIRPCSSVVDIFEALIHAIDDANGFHKTTAEHSQTSLADTVFHRAVQSSSQASSIAIESVCVRFSEFDSSSNSGVVFVDFVDDEPVLTRAEAMLRCDVTAAFVVAMEPQTPLAHRRQRTQAPISALASIKRCLFMTLEPVGSQVDKPTLEAVGREWSERWGDKLMQSVRQRVVAATEEWRK
ncbi:hypothetical protein PINS_up014828 [Pythium insidiosum]|nr:hypothetical protein PINS_up014828 [Pythium insidiosum]